MRVSQLHEKELAQLSNCNNLTALLSPKWAMLQPPGMIYYKVESERGVEAYFNVFSYKKYRKHFLITPPGFPYCGLQLMIKSMNDSAEQELKSQIVSALSTYLSDTYPKGYFDISFPPEISDMSGFESRGFEIGSKQTYRIDLSKDKDVLLKAMSSNRRRNIKSVSKGYNVTLNSPGFEGLDLVDFTLQKSDNVKMRPLYQNLLVKNHLSWANCLTVEKDEKPISAIISVTDHKEMFYFAGGYNPNIGDNNAGTIALWAAIEKAKEDGQSVFNFCGSAIPSIEKYFKSFGPTYTPYLRVRRGGQWIDTLKGVVAKIKG